MLLVWLHPAWSLLTSQWLASLRAGSDAWANAISSHLISSIDFLGPPQDDVPVSVAELCHLLEFLGEHRAVCHRRGDLRSGLWALLSKTGA